MHANTVDVLLTLLEDMVLAVRRTVTVISYCHSALNDTVAASLVPWKSGQLIVWDATTHSPGAVSDMAEESKCQKYQHLPPTHCFTPAHCLHDLWVPLVIAL